MFKKVPIILQGEVTECGLACLAMVAGFYGSQVDLLVLRKYTDVSLKGMTLNEIMRIADELRFDARAIKLEINQLNTLKLPAILHWDLNHFVVLTSHNKRTITIHDPAFGYKKIKHQRVSEHFTGIALELEPMADYKPVMMENKLRLRRLAGAIKNIKRSIVKLVGLTIFLQVFVLVAPLYIQKVVDSIKLHQSISELIFLAGIFACMKCLEIVITLFRSFSIARLGNVINLRIATNTIQHLVRLPLRYFEKRHTGDVITRIGVIDKIRQIVTQGFVEGVVDGAMSLVIASILCFYDPYIALIISLSALLYAALRLTLYKQFRASNDQLIKMNALQNTYFIEMIRGIQSIKVYGRENSRVNSWRNKYVDFLNSNLDCIKQKVLFNAGKNIIFGLELIIVILVGALAIVSNKLTLGMLYAVLFYRTIFSTAVGNLVDRYLDYKMLSLYLERLSDIVMQPVEKHSVDLLLSTKKKLSHINKIEIRNLGFRYSENDKYLFRHLNFTIHFGESVVIVGPSGLGKTTLLKIIMGLLIPSEGDVFINGFSLQELDIRAYRQKIGAVMQDDNLFSGNIYQNISFFEDEINKENVYRCANISGIHSEIQQMPMKYYSLIGDMGTVLSGGQKQRVLLARALYRQPSVLFLDESSSHLDYEKEVEVNRKIRKLPLIKIMVAHRQETIEQADRIIDLSDFCVDIINNSISNVVDLSLRSTDLQFNHSKVD